MIIVGINDAIKSRPRTIYNIDHVNPPKNDPSNSAPIIIEHIKDIGNIIKQLFNY